MYLLDKIKAFCGEFDLIYPSRKLSLAHIILLFFIIFMESNKSNGMFLILASVIVAGALMFIGNGFIQSNKDNQQTSQGITNTISVVGEGKSLVSPDTLEISTTVSEVAKTTALAQTAANEKIAKIAEILKTQGISKEAMQTTNVNVYPEYSYVNNTQKQNGYRSQQTVTIKISGEGFATSGGNVLDKIAAIGGVNIDSSYFTLKDKNAAMESARANAFADAKAKAAQLAKVGEVTLGKPVMITDNSVQYMPTPYYRNAMEMKGAGVSADSATSSVPLSPGQSEVSISINVVYEIK